MHAARQLGGGLFYGLLSALLVIGGLSLALAESTSSATPTATLVVRFFPKTLTPTLLAASRQAPLPTFPPSSNFSTLPPNIIPSATPSRQLLPTNCAPPSGWMQISIQPGDTLDSLGARYGITSAQIIQANCLQTSNLVVGNSIYVPNISQAPTATFIPCGPFSGWVLGYIVQPSDTLYHIATMYGTTVANMQRANCIADATRIFVGQRLWVPNVPTIVPALTIIPFFGTQTDVPTLPLTLTPIPDTATSTNIPPTPTTPSTVTATPLTPVP